MFFLLCSFLASFPCMSSLPCFPFPWFHSILPYFHNVFFLPTWLFHFFSLILIPSFLYLFLLVSCISSINVPFRSFLDSLHVGFTDSGLTFFYFPYVFFIPSFFEFYLTLSLGLCLMFLLVPFLLSLTDFFHCFFLSLCPILFKQDDSTCASNVPDGTATQYNDCLSWTTAKMSNFLQTWRQCLENWGSDKNKWWLDMGEM